MRYEDKRNLIKGLQKSILHIDSGSALGECESGRYVSDRKAFETYDDSTKSAIRKRNKRLGLAIEKAKEEQAKNLQTELVLSELYKQKRKGKRNEK